MKQMNSTSTTTAPIIANTVKAPIDPVLYCEPRLPMNDGIDATIPAMMISDVPLPIPRAVICSPIHSRNMVPPTRLTTAPTRNNMPGMTTAASPLCAA